MSNKSDVFNPPAKVAYKRRVKVLTIRGYLSLFLRMCVTVIVIWILFSYVFLITQCEGQGMFPSIEDGDLLLIYRLNKDYRKGDVVLYQAEEKTYLGRVVAKETDVVQMNESGTLIVNGTIQAGEIMYPTYAKEGTIYPLRIQEGEVFILGDYRTQTKDSRDIGSVSLNNIKGKVITIVRRRGV